MIHDLQKDYQVEISQDAIDRIRSKFSHNYFGLPPYAMQQSPNGLAYQCRKPRQVDATTDDGDGSQESSLQRAPVPDSSSKKVVAQSNEKSEEINYVAQRKVASALLTMVSNPLMMRHFLYKGGYDAVLKLISESKLDKLSWSVLIFFIAFLYILAKDKEVLQFCGQCLVQVSFISIFICWEVCR